MIIKQFSFKFKDGKDQPYFFLNQNIEFCTHSVNFIQGDNGVGKSTFFDILQGTTNNDSFLEMTVFLDQQRYRCFNNKLPEILTGNIHTVQQNYMNMLADKFSVYENLQLANLKQYPQLQSLPTPKLMDLLQIIGIDANKPVHLLSGGQRQLLAIVMALQKQTKLLLLDEPTATLDIKNAHIVMKCLLQLAEQLEVTIFIICHDLQLIKEYAQSYHVISKNDDGLRVIEQKYW